MGRSLLKSTANTRFVLPGSMRYVRSDVPAGITPEEREWLLARNITTIVDLRTEAEAGRKPCPLAQDRDFTYLSMPVTGGDGIPAAPEAVTDFYIRMVDAQMERILETIRRASTNVLYFCNAGKDRTGVVSAILQWEAGLSEEAILADYEISGENLIEMLTAFAAANPQIDIHVITPKREYMQQFLKWYSKVHPRQI